MLYINTIGG